MQPFAEYIRENAKDRQHNLERMYQSLQQAGLKLHRVPGVLEQNDRMEANFLNAEQGCNARGERFYIALGANPLAEKAFVQSLNAIAGDEISRVHLLDREATWMTLRQAGGISCRTKLEGDLLNT